MNKKEILYSRITKHGQDLKAVFNLDRDIDPVKLCKRLLRLETKAHKLAVDFCNGVIDQLEWDKKADQILTKVEAILKNKIKIIILGRGQWVLVHDLLTTIDAAPNQWALYHDTRPMKPI